MLACQREVEVSPQYACENVRNGGLCLESGTVDAEPGGSGLAAQ